MSAVHLVPRLLPPVAESPGAGRRPRLKSGHPAAGRGEAGGPVRVGHGSSRGLPGCAPREAMLRPSGTVTPIRFMILPHGGRLARTAPGPLASPRMPRRGVLQVGPGRRLDGVGRGFRTNLHTDTAPIRTLAAEEGYWPRAATGGSVSCCGFQHVADFSIAPKIQLRYSPASCGRIRAEAACAAEQYGGLVEMEILGEDLFASHRWLDVEEDRLRQLRTEVGNAGDGILEKPIKGLCDLYAENLAIEIPVLHHENKKTTLDRKALIEDKLDPWGRAAHRRGPLLLSGTRIETKIPFSGGAETFRIQPTTHSICLPRGKIIGNALVIGCEKIGGEVEDATKVGNKVDQEIGHVEEHLDHLLADADKLKEQIRRLAKELIEGRRRNCRLDQDLDAILRKLH